MNSLFRKATAVTLTAALGAAALTGCGSKKEAAAIDGTKTVATVNGEELPLGVLSFYARYQQAWLTQIYAMYYGSSQQIFDMVEDEATGATYGSSMRSELLEDLESMVVMRQHLDEYGVSLSDEQKAEIEKAAQAYIDNNSEEVRAKIGASKEDVMELMELQTVRSLLLDPLAKDVDTTLTDEEVNQTSVTYVEVTVPDTLPTESDAASAAEAVVEAPDTAAESGTESLVTESIAASTTKAAASESTGTGTVAASGASSVAEAVSGAESAMELTESIAEPVFDEPAPELQAYAEAKAQKVLDALLAEEDPQTADLDAVAKSVDAELYSMDGQFTTSDPVDGTVDYNVAMACVGLADNEVVDHVIKGEDGTAYYVARVNLAFDEHQTEHKREDKIVQLKDEHFTEVTDGWKEEAEISVDEDVLAKLVLSDTAPFILTPEESTDSSAESTADTAEPVEEEHDSESVAEALSIAESVIEEAAVSSAAEAPAK